MRTLAIGALCAATMISSAAFAQSSSSGNMNNAAPAPSASTGAMSSASTMGDWRASKMAGVDVYNNANEKIGDISDILIDKTGKIAGVVIGVGGFLGMGEHDVLVNFSELKFVDEPMRTASGAAAPNAAANRNSSTTGAPATTPAPATGVANTSSTRNWYPDHAVLNATKDQLKAMPEFKYTK